MTSSQLSH